MDVRVFILIIFHVVITTKTKVEIMDRVIIGQKVTIVCNIKMSQHSGMLQWLFKAYNSTFYKLMCIKRPDESECLRKSNANPWFDNVHMSIENIEIENITTQHSGTYQCKYMDSSNLEMYNIMVNVLTPPGKPKIHTSPNILVEDNKVFFKCDSFGGNPKPSLKWVWKDFSNKPIPKRNIINQTLAQTDSVYGETILTIAWIPKSFDDGNSISCIADNPLAAVASNWMYLNVNYPPIIYDFPSSPYFALLGSDISLECKATFKTTATFKWWSEKDFILADTPQLIIKSISKNHKGSYRCSVTNPFGTSAATVNISVLSSPAIEVEKVLTVIEGEKLKTICNVTPSFSNVSWWINSKCVSITKILELTLQDVTPVDIQCLATVLLTKFPGQNVLSSSQQKVKIMVLYKPRKPTISIHPEGSLLVGMDITITCVPDNKEPGFPKPDYFWQKSNSKWSKNNTNFLSFSSLTFDDSGVYICNLFNIIGRSIEVSYELTILGQPHLLDQTIHSPSIIKVKQGYPFQVICYFQAYPPPVITWFDDNSLIPDNTNASEYKLDQKQTNINSFRSILRIKKPTIQANEMYRCLASNKYGTLHHEFNIQVQYPPKFLSDIFMIAADSVGNLPGKEAVHLNCTIFGSFPISILWFRKLSNNNEKSIENSTDRYYIKEKLLNYIIESILYVRNFQNEDYGRYFCMAKNTEGQLETEFEIRKLSIPDPSHDLILFKQTWNSLSFKWVAGFDGGYPQIFLVSYTTDMQKNPSQIRTHYPNITLTNLLPDTSYSITVSSSNTLGTTQATLSVKVKTEALTIAEEKIFSINKEEQILELRLPTNLSVDTFCLTIEEMEGKGDIDGSWTMFRRCVKDFSNRLSIENPQNQYRVRICFINLPDVCSSPITNSPVSESTDTILSTKLIGTVAAACTVLVIVLAILLFFILIRTRRLLPGISDLKDIKRNRKSSRENFSNYISKPLTPICHNKHGMLIDAGGCPLLSTYSCDQVHLPNSPVEIFNVCSSHNIFNEGLYSTLVKSKSLNLFSNEVSSASLVTDPTFMSQSPCCCHNDPQMFTMSLQSENYTKPEKIFYEVMV